jgi:hypothetical protein
MPNLATVPQKKNSLATVTKALAAAKGKVDGFKDQATMVAREAVTTLENVTGAGAAGFANEYWGDADANGVVEHVTADIPTSLGAGALLKGISALGGLGEFQRDGFAFGSGLLSDYASRQGRKAAIKMKKRRAQAPAETKATPQVGPATPPAAVAPQQTPVPVAVASGASS